MGPYRTQNAGDELQHDSPRRPVWRGAGNRPLQQYRLYFLGGDGHITLSHEFEAESEAEAIRIATAWREGRRAELWSRNRKIHSWES